MTPKPYCLICEYHKDIFSVSHPDFERAVGEHNENGLDCELVPLFTADQLEAARQEAFEEAEGLCFDAANEYQQAFHGRTENLDRAILRASEVTASKLRDKIRAAAKEKSK